MRIRLLCIGRLKRGIERDLFERYWLRASAAGRGLGLSFDVDEIAESRARSASERKREEAAALADHVSSGAHMLALHEGGKSLTSEAFATSVAALRDGGVGELAAVIGGPDGLSPEFLGKAHQLVAFGAMTWPHQLVRILAAEQLYRATTILSGHPYHRA